MRLPNTANLTIEQAKIVGYLLNPAHPDNGGKAAFFLGWGFAASDWMVLAAAIREMAASSPVSGRVQSRWGAKYIVDGPLVGPRQPLPFGRSGSATKRTRRRLVTAYPRE